MIDRIKLVYDYRDMIISLVRRELRGRYQKSVLGMLWTLLNPLFQILIYTFVFTYIFPSGIENYYLHLMVALVPWTFLSDSLSQGTSSIITNADMTKKIYFPREVLPIASVLAKFVNMMLSFVIVFIFVMFSGISINIYAFAYLPIIMIIQLIFILGITLILSAVTVYFRDMEYIVGVILMAWIWATPVMYSLYAIPNTIAKLLYLNPMTMIIVAYRDILYYQTSPAILLIVAILVISIILLIIGEKIFVKLERNFAEEI